MLLELFLKPDIIFKLRMQRENLKTYLLITVKNCLREKPIKTCPSITETTKYHGRFKRN
jgi:hypothetical protein